MSTNEGLMTAWLKALAVLAWADGKLDPQEAKRLSVHAVNFGGLDVTRIEGFFSEVKEWSKDPALVAKALEPLKLETPDEGLANLRRWFDLAIGDRKEAPGEVLVIEQIAGCFLPANKVPKVLPYLRAMREAAKLEAELLPKGHRLPAPK
jgi:hypothetical protein